MTEQRPDPDALLAKVEREAAKQRRGRLKIFFGAAAGVGKSYAMLLAARERREEGDDVAIGVVETHGRADTAELLAGLEQLPLLEVPYRGTRLHEFDLDAALKRKPRLILVDELAHSNAPGSRHPKRWQDVEELLDSGIDVYTALNVQHLESLNDIVGQITGVRVWETVPDTFFERADEVELVDLPPDELLERLREGKVYLPQQAQRAIGNFFRKGNLIALRELSLRHTAARVDAQMQDYRDDHAISDVWQVAERVLVCVGPGPAAERVVRAGRRLAAMLRAEWIALYVETPKLQRLPPGARDRILGTLRLAGELGAQTMTLSAPSMSQAIIELAKQRNVTKVVMGTASRRAPLRWLLGSVVDAVAGAAEDFDLHLVGGAAESAGSGGGPQAYLDRSRAYLGLTTGGKRTRLREFAWSLVVTFLTTLICYVMRDRFELSNLIMVYLLGVLFVATRFGRGPSLVASVLSVAAFDFFFVPPYFTFAVSDTQYLVTFLVMLIVAFVMSKQTADLRSQAKVASFRERRAAALFQMTRELATSRSEDEVLRCAVRHLATEFEGPNVLLFADAEGKLRYPQGQPLAYSLRGADLALAQWVFDREKNAGRGTDTLPGAVATYFPLRGSSGLLGVVAIEAANLRRVFLPEQQRLLETFLSLIAQALERVQVAEKAKRSEIQAETESLRNALLSAISHDLRTPLAAIVGAASGLADDAGELDSRARKELSRTVYDEALRMTQLTNNILDMARLDAGSVALNLDWVSLEEIVGSVLARLRTKLEARAIDIQLPDDLPLVRMDAVLIGQVLINLLDNAAKYTPPGSPIGLSARVDGARGQLVMSVIDLGHGVPPEELEHLFDKFYRARAEREGAQSGVGLGLTICRAIMHAHGGEISAENRAGSGAAFVLRLPLGEAAPQIEPEDELASAP